MTCHSVLECLKSDEFAISAEAIATPEALRRHLLRSQEVRDIREALRQGAITETSIRTFVSSLMREFIAGKHFPHEMALAALAVALERRPTDFAEEFLLNLAKLKLAEMPMCIRVARICVKQRTSLTRTIGKSQSFFNRFPISSEWTPGCIPLTSDIKTVWNQIDMGVANAKT